jgi:hypothetical protein
MGKMISLASIVGPLPRRTNMKPEDAGGCSVS